MNKIVERRLEFLKMEAIGFSLCEIVKHLAKKYHKTERMIYYDAKTRGTWQPLYTQLFELDKARLMVLNRYEHIYREASFEFRQGSDTQKPAYLKLMLDVTNNLITLLGLQSIRESAEFEERNLSLQTELKELESMLTVALDNQKMRIET